MTIKTTAKAVYATLQALHTATDALPDGPEKTALQTALTAHHDALNQLRWLLGMTWEEFLAFIDEEAPAVAFSGGTNKDPPPKPGAP